MVYGRGLIAALMLLALPASGQERAVKEMQEFQQEVKREARSQAIEEQQNRYCTEELKQQLGEVLNSPRDSLGNVQISAYQAWKLEETYKTCSTIKNPSKTTTMLLGVIPESIKQHAREDMAREAQ